MKLIGTNALPLALESVAALRMNPNLPPDEALRPVIERHWEKEIRPRLLTEFARSCLTGIQAGAPPLDQAAARAAADWLQNAAGLDYAPAQMLLGRLYLQGLGVQADPQVAARWMIKAANQNYPHAACELGRLYANPEGGQHNPDEAARWFRRGVQEDCRSAEVGLAQMLLGAEPTTQEQQEEGFRLLQTAAQRGSVEAQYFLGVAYEQRNRMEEAVDCYRQAAVQGVLPAQAKLGALLSDGFSVKPDYVEAWVWLKRAAVRGDRVAATEVRWVEKKLTREQLHSARQRLMQDE